MKYAIRDKTYSQAYLIDIHGNWANVDRAAMFDSLLDAKTFFSEYCLEMVRKGAFMSPVEFVFIETKIQHVMNIVVVKP